VDSGVVALDGEGSSPEIAAKQFEPASFSAAAQENKHIYNIYLLVLKIDFARKLVMRRELTACLVAVLLEIGNGRGEGHVRGVQLRPAVGIEVVRSVLVVLEARAAAGVRGVVRGVQIGAEKLLKSVRSCSDQID
jgi:hypothetical protein